MAKLTKEQEYRALLLQTKSDLIARYAFTMEPGLGKLISAITAALSEPKDKGEAA